MFFAVDVQRDDTLTRSEISALAQQITSLAGGTITDLIISENTISDIIFILGRGEMFLLGSGIMGIMYETFKSLLPKGELFRVKKNGNVEKLNRAISLELDRISSYYNDK